jgi:hypothetical protein
MGQVVDEMISIANRHPLTKHLRQCGSMNDVTLRNIVSKSESTGTSVEDLLIDEHGWNEENILTHLSAAWDEAKTLKPSVIKLSMPSSDRNLLSRDQIAKHDIVPIEILLPVGIVLVTYRFQNMLWKDQFSEKDFQYVLVTRSKFRELRTEYLNLD